MALQLNLGNQLSTLRRELIELKERQNRINQMLMERVETLEERLKMLETRRRPGRPRKTPEPSAEAQETLSEALHDWRAGD